MQIQAKYPALLFKQQLDASMGKIFPMLRDSVKGRIQQPLQVRPLTGQRVVHGPVQSV